MLRNYVICASVALLAALVTGTFLVTTSSTSRTETSPTTLPTHSTDVPSDNSRNNDKPTNEHAATHETKPFSAEQKHFLQTILNAPSEKKQLPQPNVDIPAAPTSSTSTIPTSSTSTTVAPNVDIPAAPLTTTAPSPSTECGGYHNTVAAYFPASQIAKACRVMGCETGYTYDPTIFNWQGSGASGLFQFMPGTWESTTGTPAPAADYTADTQIRAAATLYSQRGWQPWTCA